MSVGGGIYGIMSVVNFGKPLAIINSDINISFIIFSLPSLASSFLGSYALQPGAHV